jgi:hypothetical protein
MAVAPRRTPARCGRAQRKATSSSTDQRVSAAAATVSSATCGRETWTSAATTAPRVTDAAAASTARRNRRSGGSELTIFGKSPRSAGVAASVPSSAEISSIPDKPAAPPASGSPAPSIRRVATRRECPPPTRGAPGRVSNRRGGHPPVRSGSCADLPRLNPAFHADPQRRADAVR